MLGNVKGQTCWQFGAVVQGVNRHTLCAGTNGHIPLLLVPITPTIAPTRAGPISAHEAKIREVCPPIRRVPAPASKPRPVTPPVMIAVMPARGRADVMAALTPSKERL